MSLKQIARRLMPARAYHWGSARLQTIRRLFIYPDTARLLGSDYDTYWAKKAEGRMGRLSSWRLKRAQVFASVVSPGDRVLDVGVGDGAIIRYLVDTRNVEAYGVDVSQAAVDFCRAHGLTVERADLSVSPEALPGGPWDYVIFSEILEHLPEPEVVLEAFRPRVRQAILVSVPNTGYVTHRLRLLLGRFPLQWVVRPGEHLRFWTITDFRWWAARLEFDVVAIFPYEGVRGLRTLWPTLFAAGVVYVLKDSKGQTPA